MSMDFDDYGWKKGVPCGTKKGGRYRIVSDPYRKRISIEKYKGEKLVSVVYDSNFLDFRTISPVEQQSWQQIPIDRATSLIRNQDDRAILYESYTFDGPHCRECCIKSVHGIPVATQKMYYEKLGDAFNGVILYDQENRPVLMKKYKVDSETGEFSDLLEIKNIFV